MDSFQLRIKCQDRGGPITVSVEQGGESNVILKFSPVMAFDDVFTIVEGRIQPPPKPSEPAPTEAEPFPSFAPDDPDDPNSPEVDDNEK